MFNVTVVCGPPAVGKSTWVEDEMSRLESDGVKARLIAMDWLCGLTVVGNATYYTGVDEVTRRWDIDTIDAGTLKRAEDMARLTLSAARFYVSDVIVEGLFHTAESRQRLIAPLLNLPDVHLRCVWLQVNGVDGRDVAKCELFTRNNWRFVQVPDALIDSVVDSMQTPHISEGWSEVTLINA